MRGPRTPIGKLGLAAVILLAPGGFLLGAGLLAGHWRQRRATRDSVPAAGGETGEAAAGDR